MNIPIIDNDNYKREDTKMKLFREGFRKVRMFAIVNKLPQFSIHLLSANHETGNKWKNKGEYKIAPREIWLNLKRHALPVGVPGYSWSYPGNKSDVTPAGVLAHELGHHCHFTHPKWRNIMMECKLLSIMEPPVTSYEPNPAEVWAEAFRLFVLNPDLLKKGRPQRYTMIRENGFKPIEKRSWEEVLAGAHDKIIFSNVSWIKKGDLSNAVKIDI